jgi:hypothetical protein
MKKRAPIEQLKAAGKVAQQMLKDKGLEAQTSILDDILTTKGAPTLPGIPTYLPHQWTLKAAQRIMYDIILLWREECKTTPNYAIAGVTYTEGREENITEFFTFVISKLREQEKEYDEDVSNMPTLLKSLKTIPLLKDVFSPVRKLENIKAIQRFFVDSFAVAIIVRNNQSTTDYVNWFLDWTQDLYSLWVKPEERDKIKRV